MLLSCTAPVLHLPAFEPHEHYGSSFHLKMHRAVLDTLSTVVSMPTNGPHVFICHLFMVFPEAGCVSPVAPNGSADFSQANYNDVDGDEVMVFITEAQIIWITWPAA